MLNEQMWHIQPMPRAEWVIQPLKEKSLHFTEAFVIVSTGK